MRFPPKPLTGILVVLGYVVVFYGMWIIMGTDYSRITESSDTILKWIVVPLAAGAVYLVIVVSALGWWRPALFEVEKAGPRWLLVGPITMALFAIVILATSDKSAVSMTMFWLALLGGLLVGFSEELVYRGALIVGLRGRFTEPLVWLFSTLVFAVMHMANGFFGEGLQAVMQAVIVSGAGTMFYLTRRVTGSLIFAMLLHAIWDFSFFSGEYVSFTKFFPYIVFVLAFVLVFILLRHERGVHTPQAGASDKEAVTTA